MASAPVGHPPPFPWATHDWSSVLLTKLGHESVLLSSGASFFPVAGGSLTIPKLTVDADAAAWLDPGEEFPTDAVEGDSVKLAEEAVGLVTGIDVEAIEDADIAMLDVVGDSLAKAIAVVRDVEVDVLTDADNEAAPASTHPAVGATLTTGTCSTPEGIGPRPRGWGEFRAAAVFTRSWTSSATG